MRLPHIFSENMVLQRDKNMVLVWSDKIDKPLAVRFAWNEQAQPNLRTNEGLPESPFNIEQ